jgi:hypothetical protein
VRVWTAAALQIAGRSIIFSLGLGLPALSATVARTAASRSSLSRLTSHQQQEAIDPTQEDTIEKEHFTTAGRPARRDGLPMHCLCLWPLAERPSSAATSGGAFTVLPACH